MWANGMTTYIPEGQTESLPVHLPQWALRLQMAEQFGIHPAEMGRLSVTIWYQWQEWEQAKAARNAIAKSLQPGANWATDLTAQERALMRWADDENKPNGED